MKYTTEMWGVESCSVIHRFKIILNKARLPSCKIGTLMACVSSGLS